MINVDKFKKLLDLINLKKGGSKADLINNGNFQNSLYRSKKNQISDIFTFPHIRQSDPRIVRLKLEVFYDVVRKYKISNSTSPLKAGEIDANIMKLLSTTTHVVESGVPGVDDDIRKTHFEEAGIQDTYDPQDREYLLKYTKFLYSAFKPTNVRIPLDSNRGLGTEGVDKLKSITDPIYFFKASLIMKKNGLLESKDYKKIGDFLWDEASINLYGTIIQRRQARNTKLYDSRGVELDPHSYCQEVSKKDFVDKFLSQEIYCDAKPRKIFDPVKGNRDAEERRREDRLFVDGKNREAINFSSIPNKFGNMIVKPVYSSFKDEYKETFKFRSLTEENEQVRSSQNVYFISHDVDKYDRNFTNDDFQIIEEAISNVLSPNIAVLSNLCRGYGVILPYKGKVYISDQKEPVKIMISGSPRTSGDGATKNSGIQMLSHGVPADDDNFRTVLKWRPNPYGNYKNNSDDAFDAFPSLDGYNSFSEKYDKNNKYFNVSSENACVYSGKCLHDLESNRFAWTDTPSSVLVNILVREYSFGYYSEYDNKLIGSKPYSTMGYLYKRESENPLLRDLINTLEENFRNIFKFDLWDYLKKYLKFPNISDLNNYELEYLMDPSVVSWKLTSSEVDQIRDELIKDNFITFEREVVEYIYEQLR